jgi:hypothetical protein
VSAESRRAGKAAARYISGNVKQSEIYKKVKADFGVSYTVPQKIRLENIDDKLEIFMRVNNVYRDVKLEVKDGDQTLVSLTKKHLAPGEMEKIILPKKILDKIVGDELKVSIAEVK